MPKTKSKAKPGSPKRARTRTVRYRPHPYLDREQKLRATLEAETGRPWAAWLATARAKGLARMKPLQDWLQAEHGLPCMAAGWIAYEAVTPSMADYGDPEVLVDALYSGEKAALRPLHESIVDVFLGLGDDVLVTACKTMVPVYRKHVFAELRPGKDCVEVSLALGDTPVKGRLERAAHRAPDDRLTRRVRVGSRRDVDATLKAWIAAAYEQGARKRERAPPGRTPPDLARALHASKSAATTWETLTPAMRGDMIEWIVAAKQDETRARRVATAVSKLAEGKRRVY